MPPSILADIHSRNCKSIKVFVSVLDQPVALRWYTKLESTYNLSVVPIVLGMLSYIGVAMFFGSDEQIIPAWAVLLIGLTSVFATYFLSKVFIIEKIQTHLINKLMTGFKLKRDEFFIIPPRKNKNIIT